MTELAVKNCGGCRSGNLTVEHWKECLGVQCKCLHYRRHHNRIGKNCKRCRCHGFETVIGFDEFFQWSQVIRPASAIVSKTGEIVRPKDLSPQERRMLQGEE